MDRTRWLEAWDEEGWKTVVAKGGLAACPPEAVVAAIRTIHRTGDAELVGALTVHVSDLIARRLRFVIGADHANRGDDMVERAHGALLLAIFDPASDDGRALCKAFWPRVKFRAIDAVRHELLHRRRHRELPIDSDGEIAMSRTSMASEASAIELSQHLTCISDPRKRLAFRLYAEGMQIRTGDPCISGVLGCDPKTAKKWIEQARQTLAEAGFGGRR